MVESLMPRNVDICRKLGPVTMKKILLLLSLLQVIACTSTRPKESWTKDWVVKSPAGEQYCQINPEGVSIIPNGRLIQPMGKTIRIAPHPYGLALVCRRFYGCDREFR
jgi:hypothetical protein